MMLVLYVHDVFAHFVAMITSSSARLPALPYRSSRLQPDARPRILLPPAVTYRYPKSSWV
ncbi:hypothetical protein KCP69_24575 [Salmonella enterica subsp. enterica]|nr:hypothetical protein KCP69_24575 [Salmonella enterica subsp. enterica]